MRDSLDIDDGDCKPCSLGDALRKETDKEFLLRMAGEVNSECWGTPEQEADQTRIKGIANRLNDQDYRIEMYTKHNNPNGYEQKYGADHSVRMTLGELVDKFLEAVGSGADDDELGDFISEEFLFGCWRDELEMRDPDMLRNIRGIIINLLRRVS